MAKSIRKRLEEKGQLKQFIEDVGIYGIWVAMDKYGFKDYLAVKRLIVEETGNQSYGDNPKLASYHSHGIQALLREVVAAFANYVVESEREKERLRRELEALQPNYRMQEEALAESLLSLKEYLETLGVR
jgi:hypothetical protein